MDLSDSLALDHDMNSDFIIIQSCLRDEQHSEFIQNCEYVVLIEDHLTFNLGDSFESFEDVKLRLEAHSSHSNIHYWMRDTRTVAGARKKTTRHIEPRLKYYVVKYACVYGGYKHNSKSSGKRNSTTQKLDCPAHVSLRANYAGERLDVVSVCNHHNHDVSSAVSQLTRQGRRLSSPFKEEVLDLLRMGVLKQKILNFIRWRSGKQVRYKDVINLATTVKGTPPPSPDRSWELQQLLKSFEVNNHFNEEVKDEIKPTDHPTEKIKNRKRKLKKKKPSCDTIETEDTCQKDEFPKLEAEHHCKEEVQNETIEPMEYLNEKVKNGKKKLKKNKTCDNNTTKDQVESSKLDMKDQSMENLMNVDFNDSSEANQKYEEADLTDNAYIEHCDSSNMHARNIMEYLYTDCDGQSILTVLNHKEITLEPAKTNEVHSDVSVNPIINIVPNKQKSIDCILNKERKLELETNETELGGNTLTLQNDVDQITVKFDDNVSMPDEIQNIDTSSINFIEKPVLTILNNEIDITPIDPDAPEHYLNHVIKDTSLLQDAEFEHSINFIDLPEENNLTISEDIGDIHAHDLQILNDSEIIMEETWMSGDSIDGRDNVKQESVNMTKIENYVDDYTGKCSNCEKMQLDLNVEVKALQNEKKNLTEETENLRKQRNYLLEEINFLKKVNMKQRLNLPTGLKLVMKQNKLYLIRI